MRNTIFFCLLLIAITFAFPADQDKALRKFYAAVGQSKWGWPSGNLTCSVWGLKCDAKNDLVAISITLSGYGPVGQIPSYVLTHLPALEKLEFPNANLNGSLVQGIHFPNSVKQLDVRGSAITELGLSGAQISVEASNVVTLKKITVEASANVTSLRLTQSKADALVIRGSVNNLFSENLGLTSLDIADGVSLGEVWLNGGNVTKVNWKFHFDKLHLSHHKIVDATLNKDYRLGYLELSHNRVNTYEIPTTIKFIDLSDNLLGPVMKFTLFNSDFSNNALTTVNVDKSFSWANVTLCDFSGNPLKCPIPKELSTNCFATCQ